MLIRFKLNQSTTLTSSPDSGFARSIYPENEQEVFNDLLVFDSIMRLLTRPRGQARILGQVNMARYDDAKVTEAAHEKRNQDSLCLVVTVGDNR